MLNFEIEKTIKPEFIQFTTIGSYAFDEMDEFLRFVRSEADKAERVRVLIDSSQIKGQMTEAERFQGGQMIADIFGHRLKLALIMPPGGVTKLGELTAVNRGARFLVTTSATEAETWLLND
jgi:hypothetical protein